MLIKSTKYFIFNNRYYIFNESYFIKKALKIFFGLNILQVIIS